jgi:NADPH-dependent ferric siderophore reductase
MLDAFFAGARGPDAIRRANLRRPARLSAAVDLSPSIRRLTFDVAGLGDIAPLPGQWIGLHLPDGEGFQRGRAYTLRAVAGDTIVLDLARHPRGLCAAWARRARPGDEARISGPRPGFKRGGRYRHLVLGGDETALAAIATALERLPAGVSATACIEVPDAADRQELRVSADVMLHWLPRRGRPSGAALAAALTALPLPPDCGVWIAAERAVALALRDHFAARLGPGHVAAAGYWRHPPA